MSENGETVEGPGDGPTEGTLRTATYPKHREADVVLSDGGTVHVRPITPDDAEAIVEFHKRLSERSRYFRYFGPYPRIPQRDLTKFTTVDHHDRVAFVALLGGEIISVGRYERLDSGPSAEVAFVVADAHQGRGLGSILLEHLAAAATESGISRFVAEVLAENAQMVRVFRDAGYHVSREIEQGVVHLEFAIDPTERSVEVAQQREQAAEARSVHNLLHPRSVALIGASSDPTKVGYAVLSNLLGADFTGPVYPVNPEHVAVRGVPAYPSVTAIPDVVDLAVVAVPASGVDDVMDACLEKEVKTMVVLSSGFADAGPDGRSAERRLSAEARAHGMRMVGPNALGVVNTDPTVRLNATLASRLPGPGRTGFFCQSGALGIAILADAAARGLGLSTFVSAGNRADVSGNDLLQYWETDNDTDVVLLYLESFGNPRKFARLARRLARHKPVVAVKSGRHAKSPALAGNTVTVDEESVATLFEQAGVIRVESIAQLFDTALLLANQPLPRGDRVGVVGNSTAIGVLAADTAQAQGMKLAFDPVDTSPQASPEQFANAVAEALAREDVDSLVVVFVPPLAMPGSRYARALRDVVREASEGEQAGKPIVTTFLAMEGVPAELAAPGASGAPGRGSIPSYPSPERAVMALARATRYAQWRAAPLGDLTRPAGIDGHAARELMGDPYAVESGERRLSDEDVVRLLGCYGISVESFTKVDDADACVAAAESLGYPVVVKSTNEDLHHRIDLAGVRLDLSGAEEVERAYRSIVEASGTERVYVQRMAPNGAACAIGLVDDPSFGSLVTFGLSGMVTELVGDRAYRAVPLTDTDAAWLVRAPRTAPLLAGWRGLEPADLTALEDLALRVSALAEDLPEVRSLSLEPILASADGAAIANARITVGDPPSRQDSGPRRLRAPGPYRSRR